MFDVFDINWEERNSGFHFREDKGHVITFFFSCFSFVIQLVLGFHLAMKMRHFLRSPEFPNASAPEIPWNPLEVEILCVEVERHFRMRKRLGLSGCKIGNDWWAECSSGHFIFPLPNWCPLHDPALLITVKDGRNWILGGGTITLKSQLVRMLEYQCLIPHRWDWLDPLMGNCWSGSVLFPWCRWLSVCIVVFRWLVTLTLTQFLSERLFSIWIDIPGLRSRIT